MHSKNQKRHSSPVPSQTQLAPMKPKAPAVAPTVAPSPGDTLPFRVPRDYPHSRFSKAPLAVYPPKGARSKTCVTLPVVSLEKMPCLSRGDPASHVRLISSSSSSSSSPVKSLSIPPSHLSQRSSEKLTNGRSSSGPSTPRSTPSPSPSPLDKRPSPARSPLDRRATPTQSPAPSLSPSHRSVALPAPSSLSPLEKKHQNGTKGSSRSHKRLSGRVFDPNKHCGVPDPETKRPCTRSLTCKTHSLTHRRAVLGRKNNFDILLAEHKGRAKEVQKEKEREKEAAQELKERKESSSQNLISQETVAPTKPHVPNGRLLSTLKLRLANAHIPRVPGGSSSAASAPSLPAAAPALNANSEPSPHSSVSTAGEGARLSSDEGDAESPDDTDKPTFHYSCRHPQPLGVCIFRSRLMGRGHYVFDRRWDRMRLAVQSMVEKHLNAQMWKKVPPASESLLSSSSSSSPASLTSPPYTSLSYTAAFPQSSSTAGLFHIRDSPQAHANLLGKARTGPPKPPRTPRNSEESAIGAKKRKTPSPLFSSSTLFPVVNHHKKNGNSFHPALHGSEKLGSSPSRKKGLVRGDAGLWNSSEDWLNRADGSQNHNTHNRRETATTTPYSPNRDPASVSHQTMAPPTGLLTYGGGAEGRKRRSPSSYRAKGSKLSRPDRLESFFGRADDGERILASGPESQRRAQFHH
ncbi:ataxin-7-like protein 1 isoform X1 [Gouania willdenowi]|uniref:Ataxin-7-like protein 1 n=1 Tax=Gouania willdenowi TaxID=441366 RepID=A0A8C5DCK2_GOUWI|nr:ataxin-7-like protein 1 isoform X1 [Gouania willdenowi]XP_028306720.1 ataxin-7-like protein 1 isoform X1 [Gouania willdenowi]